VVRLLRESQEQLVEEIASLISVKVKGDRLNLDSDRKRNMYEFQPSDRLTTSYLIHPISDCLEKYF
jgi:hypothetical protein